MLYQRSSASAQHLQQEMLTIIIIDNRNEMKGWINITDNSQLWWTRTELYNSRCYRFDRKPYFLSSLIFSEEKHSVRIRSYSLRRTCNQDPWLVYHFFQELNCNNYICITLPFKFLADIVKLFSDTLIHLIHVAVAWLDKYKEYSAV